MNIGHRRAALDLMRVLLVALSFALARTGNAADARSPHSNADARVSANDVGTASKRLWSKVQVAGQKRVKRRRALRRGADDSDANFRAAEEAARLQSRRETQRKLDQIILEQLLRDAARR